MKMKTKALVFISTLVLVFSITACKQSGEAEKPVKKAAESPSINMEINADKTLEKANEAVSNAVEEVNKKVDEAVDNATVEVNNKVDEAADSAEEKVNENIDDASKKIGGAYGINTEE